VGIRHDEEAQPDTAHVPDRELARAHHRKDRHGFRRSVHTRTPALAEQQKDRRDQGPGVTDTNPPNEVGDIPAPANGTMQVPLTYSIDNLFRNGPDTEDETSDTDQKPGPPEFRG